MPYSKKLETELLKSKISIGDKISVSKNGKTYEGILMPRIELGDQNCLVIKLDSGYNIGISFDGFVKISKSVNMEPKTIVGEEKFEMGKIKKSLLKIEFDAKKPRVSLIATGGTIASRVDYETGGVKMMMEPEEFLHNVPELANIINLKILNPFNKASEDMNYLDWIEIAKLAAKELNSGAEGVIITHGTDFLHYTSAALSFFLKNLSKPVVLAGSQKSSDRGSSDGGINLMCSAYAAVSDIAEVGICMHGSTSDTCNFFIRGTKARKMDTVRRDAFRPINDLPIANIWPDGKVEAVKKDYKKRCDGKVELDIKFEPKIALLKAYPGSDSGIIDYLVSKGCKGFVIEGSGLGHVPTNGPNISWIPQIKKYTSQGIPFVVCSQTIYGRVNTNVYANLRTLYYEAGAISGEDMLAETAYIKLGWVLGHTKDMQEIKKMMMTNIAGEITERSLPETFLY